MTFLWSSLWWQGRGGGWGGVLLSSPFLDSAFQQQMTGWGQLGSLMVPQECGRKAGRDMVAVRKEGCSLHPRGGEGVFWALGAELGAEGKDWTSLIKPKRLKPDNQSV